MIIYKIDKTYNWKEGTLRADIVKWIESQKKGVTAADIKHALDPEGKRHKRSVTSSVHILVSEGCIIQEHGLFYRR